MKRLCHSFPSHLVAAALLLLLASATPLRSENQLDGSESMFTMMAALDAAGFGADLDSPSNHPLRLQVRQHLASRPLASVARLKQFFESHRQDSPAADLSQYISYALVLGPPPDFRLRLIDYDVPPDVERLEGLNDLLAEFYREAGIAELWANAQPAFDQAIERYHEPTSTAVLELNGYLRNPTSGDSRRRFGIVICLLGPPNQIQTRSYDSEYFVVLTSSPEPQIQDIRYAYLHYLLDPLAIRYQENLGAKSALGDYALGAPYLADHYKYDFRLLAVTSLIDAIEARLARAPEKVDEAYRRGFILAPHFAEQLAVYERQEQSMRFYFPTLVDSIDLAKEEARASTLEFDQTAPVRTAKPVQVPQPEPTAMEQALLDAEELYRNRELDEARQAFLRIAGAGGSQAYKARAYYGLARIATLQNDPELAMTLFNQTLELSPGPNERAWSLVYLGRLHDVAGEHDQALELYRAALAVQGATAGATEMAVQGAKGDFRRAPDGEP